MKFITHAAEPLALLLTQPNRATHPRLTPSLPFTDIAPGLTHQESRRTFATSTRYSYEFTPLFRSAAEATEFRLGLNRLKDETIALPLWDDSVLLSAAVSIGATSLPKTAQMPVRHGAEWILTDGSAYEIVTVTALTSSSITIASGLANNWPAASIIYPLLFCRFAERPSLDSMRPDFVGGALRFIEHATFARRINVVAGLAVRTVGSTIPDFAATPLWDIEPIWSDVLDTTEADIIYQQLGFLRGEQTQVYEQAANRRGLEIEIDCNSRENIAKAERFFMDRRGPVRTFMVPTFRNDLVLTQDLPRPAEPNRIDIAASEYSSGTRPAHPGDPYLAIVETITPGAPVINPQRVTAIAAGQLTTEEEIGATHLAARSRLSHLLLVRFAEPTITWEYLTPIHARARLKFVEIPDEYASPASDLPLSAYLYKFQVTFPATTVLGRYTSHENAITYDSQSWTPAPWSHGPITRTLDLSDKTEITSWGGNFPGNPLAKFLPLTLEGDLYLEITEVNADDPADAHAEVLFYGKVKRPRMKGNDWRADVVAFDFSAESKYPRHLIRRNDNFVMFTRPTGLDEADFDVPGTIDALDGVTIEIAGPAQAADYFAGGWLTRGAGAAMEGRGILSSQPIAGGQRLTLDRPFTAAVLTEAVLLYPGYDGSLEQYLEKFSSGDPGGFGGMPFVTDTGPQIKAADAVAVGGGKKG